jgi:hypothetical protein
MIVRRMRPRRIGLTVAFLALAAGGVAACDSPEPETTGSEVPFSSDLHEIGAEVFYCADADGMVVEDRFCDGGYPGGTYFLWHSPWYSPDLTPGEVLGDGDHFDASDKAGRKAFKLPGTGPVTNGTTAVSSS